VPAFPTFASYREYYNYYHHGKDNTRPMKDWPLQWIIYKTNQDDLPNEPGRKKQSYKGRKETWRKVQLIALEGERLGGLAQLEEEYRGYLSKVSDLVKEIGRRKRERQRNGNE
jgi:hypothetical protein